MWTKIAMVALTAVLLISVLWETMHLVDWCGELFTRYGDGTLAGYLRMHAYTYVTFVFGEGAFGWTVV